MMDKVQKHNSFNIMAVVLFFLKTHIYTSST
jgi:hypothetical protein